jgi:hypothetical protein
VSWKAALLELKGCGHGEVAVVGREVRRVLSWTPGALQEDDLWAAGVEAVWRYLARRAGRPPKQIDRTKLAFVVRDALRRAVIWERRTSAVTRRAVEQYTAERNEGWPFRPAARCGWCGCGITANASLCRGCKRVEETTRAWFKRAIDAGRRPFEALEPSLCVDCDVPVPRGSARCAEHAYLRMRIRNRQAKARYRERKAS